ncbi:Thiamine pyrophosphate enzyme, C-terminal TPP-binding [Fusarium austroafricanum]|uniref:Pyruvate decarboxylase n=1 Tax=Fusarium austroafricanum TaxID=2364996 RepID=A0A8H4JQE4_9HYPO|nr:Thiamine pyrophosphate enzyme, C-terminal TPP-binding [Fusarium austroafricanum]
MEDQVTISEYLFLRLAQLGAGSVHGVPGDYNLAALDYVTRTGLRWVGNANELNAGYAADAYARVKGIGVLFTPFGPGELSALNAIAGAYAEKAPVVHIVGTPPRWTQKAGTRVHHSLGDGNFSVFADMYKAVTVAQADLSNPATAVDLIDLTLQQCILHSLPVYFTLPADMALVKVPVPTASINVENPDYHKHSEDQAVEVLIANLQNSKRPLLLVDGLTARFRVRQELNQLVRLTGIPTLATPFGNGLVDSSYPNYHGIYHGQAGPDDHFTWVQGCDLVLRFGPLDSDLNTFAFTTLPNAKVTVTFDKFNVHFGEDLKGQVKDHGRQSIKSLLRSLLLRLKDLNLPTPEAFPHNPSSPQELLKIRPLQPDEVKIDQDNFWLRMSEFLKPGDHVMLETGTALHGGLDIALPDDCTVTWSAIWGSIGYMLAGAQGASLAHRELVEQGVKSRGRTILFEGEGSLQMAAQAISDMIRNKLDVTIFILNNNGYTIERLFHGFDEGYNDIQPWRYLEGALYFGAPLTDSHYPVINKRAGTWGELLSALQDPEVQKGKGLTMVEVIMDADDFPTSLRTFGEVYMEKQKKLMKENSIVGKLFLKIP